MQQTDTSILKTKAHFEILDGLRGIAAVAIVVFHFMEIAYSDYSKNFIAHGFLAVDFFFCLSGFVIGYAYDDRIDKMGVMEFFKSRMIRLHPLVIAGSVLGLLGFLLYPVGGHPEPYGSGKILLIFVSSVLLIPFPSMPDRYFNLFSFNAPAWSLFWEYAANIVYAFFLYRIVQRYLLLLVTAAAAALCFVSYQAGSLMGGWSGETFWHGGARIAYSFLAGLLVYRSGWIIRNKLGFTGIALLLVLSFIMPFNKWNPITEPLVVLCYFPLLVALGAGASLSAGIKKLCIFSGKISYPLYMTHYVVMWIFAGYYSINKPGTIQLSCIIIAGTTLLVLFAYLIMVVYDMPLRKYLTERRKKF